MYSLLQTHVLKKVRSMHFERKVVVVSCAVSAVSLVGLLALLPAYIESGSSGFMAFIEERMSNDEEQILSEDGSTIDRGPSSDVAQERAGQLLALVQEQQPAYSVPGVVDYVRARFLQNAQVKLALISMRDGKISVTGSTSTRAELIDLTAVLRADSQFSDVDLPLSALSGREGLFPFAYTIVPKKNGDFTVVK
jgi:hypothetical protein